LLTASFCRARGEYAAVIYAPSRSGAKSTGLRYT
jgi:hypothetical protein